jgi:LuxR family transcriptional regulator, maltose regulon positive regulatory protein
MPSIEDSVLFMLDVALLATKMQIPPYAQKAARRARLTDRLEQEVPRHKLSVVVAPAGYGKTTLLAQWAHSSRLRIAWLSLDEEDNDLERFLRYLLATWEKVQPDVGESSLAVLLTAMSPASEAVLPAFINVANELPDHLVFVLDDYHLTEEPAIHEAMTFLLDHLPPTLHFVLAGRSEPPLPIARYRARQQLVELRAGDLRFSQTETVDFLSHLMSLSLSPDEVAFLYSQTEGWIAGLQLVALTLRHGRDHVESRLAVSGRHRFIADYLAQDVLAGLPSDVRDFLLKTSILDPLCGPLADAVTQAQHGQEMLELVERENLFLAPLDDNRQWFRYHSLFADFLRGELNRLQPQDITRLHRRAAAWYATHDLPEQAFDHALVGEDVERVVQIVDRYLSAKLYAGDFKVAKHWLDSLPAAWIAAYPVLDLARAGFLAYTGAFDACVRCVDEVEQRLRSAGNEETQWQLARVTAVRCFLACMANDLAQAEALADQALGDLPDEDLGFRPGIYVALGDTYRQNGRWEEAKASYLRALDFTHAPPIRVQAAHVLGALADLELKQGRLQNAAGYWRRALAAIQQRENWGRLPLPVIGWVFMRLGELLYEWNELAEARQHVARGLERAELGGDVRALIAGYLLSGRLQLAQGEVEAAQAYLKQARPLVESAQFAEWTARFQRFQLELWLAQDRLRAAVHWADEMLPAGQPESPPENEVADLAMARVLLVKGDAPSVARAMGYLVRLIVASEAEGRTGVLVEALALQALGYSRRGDQAGAMTSLERALRLAEPEGYVRLFADLGLPMARLLQEARARDVLPGYVAKLLAAFGADLVLPDSMGGALPEPLTPREQEVLELLAAGLTNREIGEALVISAETVKKHTGNIYGKLGSSNRTEAVAQARELDLLN